MISSSASKNGAELRRSFGQSRAPKISFSLASAIVPRRVDKSKASSFIQKWRDRCDVDLLTHLKRDPARLRRNRLGKSIGPLDHAYSVAKNNFVETNRPH